MEQNSSQVDAILAKAHDYYLQHYAHTQPELLDRAIALGEEARSLASSSLQQTRALSIIGAALLARYWGAGSLADLTECIEAYRASAALAPKHQSHLPTVYGLGSSLLERFRLTTSRGDPEAARRDLDEAIDRLNFAVRLIEHNRLDVLQHTAALDDLGAAYRERYQLGGRRRDYRRAIKCHKRAFKLLPPLHTLLYASIPNLEAVTALCERHAGEAFLAHFARTRNANSLGRAIVALDRSLGLKRDALTFMAAATAWAGSSKLTGAAHSKERARQYLRAAVARGLADAPLLAVRASRAWIGWLLDGTLGDAEASETLDEAVEAAELGWQATQRLVTTQVDRAFEAGARRQVVGFGAEAAFVFSERGLIAKAMTVAESTAAAIAGDVHQALEGELAQLEREGHGALAESYRTSARALLEATRSNESPTVTDDNEAASSSATLVMDDVIARIRALPGHKHFGRVTDPVALHQSIGAREDWLYIMASPWGTVALLIRSDGSHARSVIRELTRDQVEQSCEALSRLSGRTLSRQKRDSIARSAMLWLGDVLWDRLYSDLGLGSAALAVFPGGLFAVLPIEPARLMNPTRQARPAHAVRLFPSVALLKRSAQGRRTALDTALVVADPRLPGASADLRIVRTVFGQDSVETYIDGKADDTDLLGKMSNRSLIHFACHGEANLVDPEMSSITLGADRDLTVGELWHLELNATRLVVIGTCQSARTGGSLVDELVTFPTVFMRGGAGTVLATLWDIGDDATSKLLQVFYSELRQSATVADAVCASQLYFMESPAPSVGPGDWAALVCYG